MTLHANSTTPSATWPANDPATWRSVPTSSTPVDPERVQAMLDVEWERFATQTTGSAAHHARAIKSLPLGVPSSFQHWDPYPIAINSARGAWLKDVDDRPLLDLSMGFGAMLVGHLNPARRRRLGPPRQQGCPDAPEHQDKSHPANQTRGTARRKKKEPGRRTNPPPRRCLLFI